jgi:hypothetical protein
MGTGSFPGVKCGRGVTLTPHHLLVPWSRKGRTITLLPLRAKRPVQGLSACTRVHFLLLLLHHWAEDCNVLISCRPPKLSIRRRKHNLMQKIRRHQTFTQTASNVQHNAAVHTDLYRKDSS